MSFSVPKFIGKMTCNVADLGTHALDMGPACAKGDYAAMGSLTGVLGLIFSLLVVLNYLRRKRDSYLR